MNPNLIFKILGAILVVAASFFATLTVLDLWGPADVARPIAGVSPLKEPSFNVASLPHLTSGQTLDFSDGKNRAALISGWAAETNFAWTEGHSAFLAFVVDLRAGANPPQEMTLSINPVLIPGKVEAQRIQIWYHNEKLGGLSILGPTDSDVSLEGIPVSNGTAIILGFDLTDAVSPAALNFNGDTRVLAIAIKSIKLSS